MAIALTVKSLRARSAVISPTKVTASGRRQLEKVSGNQHGDRSVPDAGGNDPLEQAHDFARKRVGGDVPVVDLLASQEIAHAAPHDPAMPPPFLQPLAEAQDVRRNSGEERR